MVSVLIKNAYMILDNLSNAANYFGLHPLFEKAFEHIKEWTADSAPSGTVEIDGAHLRASVAETALKDKTAAKLETHRKYIDIHIPLSCAETFGWKSLSELSSSENGYNADDDFELWHDTPSTYFTAQTGEFVIFSPEDGHAPLVGEGDIKKIIIKVAVI